MSHFVVRRMLVVLLSVTLSSGVWGQTDAHFSQYYVYPAWLNPALTGVFDGDYRVAGIYRNQWAGISAAFQTAGVSAEWNTTKNISVGVSGFHQQAGTGGYFNTSGYGSVSFNGVRFGAQGQHRVTMALQAGIWSRGFNRSKVTFEDGYDDVTGQPRPGGSNDPALRGSLSTTSFDAGAGILYFDATPGKKANVYGGFSVSHLTRTKDYVGVVSTAVVPMRYNIHAGVRIAVSEQFSFTPNVLYMRQGTAEEKMVGGYAQLNAAPETDLLLGANYRFQDAISPYVGVNHKNMILGVSYDINNSDLGKLGGGANAFEVSLSFTFRKKERATEYEFVCPRL